MVQSSPRAFVPISMLIVTVVAGCGTEPNGPPRLLGIQPAQVPQTRRTPARVSGENLYATFKVHLDNDEPHRIRDLWRVWVGSTPLTQAVRADSHTIDVLIPSGLPLGQHDLRVLAPTGETLVLPDALTVQLIGGSAGSAGAGGSAGMAGAGGSAGSAGMAGAGGSAGLAGSAGMGGAGAGGCGVADTDGDGVPNGCDVCPGSDDTLDADTDGVPDGCDVCPGSDDNLDTDHDGICDLLDTCTDADGDGLGTGANGNAGCRCPFTDPDDSVPTACDYTYRKRITVHATQVSEIGGADLPDFPVAVSLSADPDLAHTSNGGHVSSSVGDDITFYDAENLLLDYELQTYDIDGTVIAWVRFPSLSATVDTTFYIYYGSQGAASLAEPPAVWGTDHQAVWHFEQNPWDGVDAVVDSTSTGAHGTASGTNSNLSLVSGVLGSGLEFGKQPSVAVNAGSSATFTVSGWIYIPSSEKSSFGTIIGYDRFWTVQVFPNRKSVGLWDESDPIRYIDSTPAPLDAWYHFAVVATNHSAHIYLNGDLNVTKTYTQSSALVFDVIGKDTKVGEEFSGRMDELRVEFVVRDDDWINTRYRNERAPASFYSLGSEETL